MKLQALSGMKDYLGYESEELTDLSNRGLELFARAGFRQIRTPLLEEAELFDRSLGSGSEVVNKQMYTVQQGGDRLIALRPENTAGVVRAVNENRLLSNRSQLKLCYAGPMFRHERPQSGRLRQFHQLGLELFGRSDPLADAEVIWLGQQLLQQLRIDNTKLLINSIGCTECRPDYIEKLIDAVEPAAEKLCQDCQQRLSTNPLRLLDCKNSCCQELYSDVAPSIVDHICDGCRKHLEQLQEYLALLGVESFLTASLVRGLDYYNRTTFEFVSGDLGQQDAVLAGGRYDGLVEQLGGEACPAIGFSAGLERIMLLRSSYNDPRVDVAVDCYFLPIGKQALYKILPLVAASRSDSSGLRVELGNPEKTVKSQLRRANRYGARAVLICGEQELDKGLITYKDMASGEQTALDLTTQKKFAEQLKRLYFKFN